MTYEFGVMFQENCEEFEAVVTAQCDALIEAIRNRRAQLLECIRQDKDLRVRALKEQVATCTARLQQTTALLQFCIEALKETDSAAFLQVSAFVHFTNEEARLIMRCWMDRT